MIPVPALIWLLFYLLRQAKSGPGASPQSGRGKPSTSTRASWSWLVWLLVGPLAASLLILAMAGDPVQFLPFALCLLVLFPWHLNRATFVRWGFVRGAYRYAWLAGHTFRRDPRGGAVLAGARALLRRRQPDPAARLWLEQRLERAPRLGGAAVTASGLLAAERGDLPAARMLLASVETLHPRSTPSVARRMAGEWIAAEAASRGAWAEVARAAGAAGARSRVTRLLGELARRVLGEDRPAWRLRLLWAIAPRRRATIGIVRRVLHRPIRRTDRALPVARAAPLPAAEPLAEALRLHARLAAEDGSRLGPRSLRRVAGAWERALRHRDTHRWIAARAFRLGLASGSDALARLERTVEEDLVRAARRVASGGLAGAPGAAGSALWARVQRKMRDGALGEIELATIAIEERAAAKRALPPLEEWRTWCALRTQCERAALEGGPDQRRLIYATVHHTLGSFAVWQWNERRECALAHAVFRWLLDEAVAVADARAAEVQLRNTKLKW